MARADRRRSQRAGAHADAAGRARSRARVADETLFFQRIRNQAKWIFAIIALLFALSTVLLGVGTGFGGLQDILVQQSAGGGPSEEDAREAIEENPNNAQAHYDLSTALQGQGELDEAIPPLEKYVRLRPGDLDGKRELAGLYLQLAERHRRAALVAQTQLQLEAPGQTFQLPSDSKLSQALPPDQITSAVAARWNEELNRSLTAMQGAYTKAVGVYKQIANATPTDPSAQLELAQAAEAANDFQSALAAYKQFLKLAPDDQSAPAVRDRVKQLEGSAG